MFILNLKAKPEVLYSLLYVPQKNNILSDAAIIREGEHVPICFLFFVSCSTCLNHCFLSLSSHPLTTVLWSGSQNQRLFLGWNMKSS